MRKGYSCITLQVTYNCSAFGAIFFVPVSLVRENLRGLRENLKHKIRPLDSLPEQYRDFYGRQLIARLEQKCLSKKDITE